MKELWIGRVEMLTEPTDWGDTKAFTNVIARADDTTDFRNFVSHTCEEYGWSLLSMEECNPASALKDIINEELLEGLECAKSYAEACIFTTLHYYPSKPI